MSDSMYPMTLKLLKKSHLYHNNVNILPSFAQRYNGGHYI